MFKKIAAILIAATVVGAPMIASVSSAQATENRTTVKVVKPHKVVVVKKHAAHRHHGKYVKVVSGHRHGKHVTVVKHRKHVNHANGSKKVVIKKVTRAN